MREDELKSSGLGAVLRAGAGVDPVRDARADLLLIKRLGGEGRPTLDFDRDRCSGSKYLLSRKFGLGGGEYSLS